MLSGARSITDTAISIKSIMNNCPAYKTNVCRAVLKKN